MSNMKKVYELTSKQKKYFSVKRILDIMICLPACIALAPLMGIFALAIKADSPGPVLFKQKRVGKDKELFEIWKFRTMYTETPKDMPTHMLSNPEQFITRTGKFMRKFSIDELPQIYQCIFTNSLSLCGPRPALWNQYDLVAERDKYGANSVKPGITGWAQINGRDELEISDKARFDGEYVENFGLWMDVKCFLGTIGSVILHDGVVEGGTGELHMMEYVNDRIISSKNIKKVIMIGGAVVISGITVAIVVFISIYRHMKNKNIYFGSSMPTRNSILILVIGITISAGFFYTAYLNAKRKVMLQDNFETEDLLTHEEIKTTPKKVLITGANSYIGSSVEKWLNKEPDKYYVSTIDLLNNEWKEQEFSEYDVVFHVAGIAHVDVGSISEEQKQLYYKVNTDLTVDVAEKSKSEGVKQFIFMSSMIVYAGCNEKIITSNIQPKPLNFYGDSKWQAEQKLRNLESSEFKVVVLRPPMIYGKGSKGNYSQLSKLAIKLPIFPIVKNKRSMLHIDNLCEFIKLMIENNETGIFFPQNGQYTNTSDMVQMIAIVKGNNIIMVPFTNLLVKLMGRIPGKIGSLATKAFGDLAYEMGMSEYKENYRVNSLRRSIELTEGDN